MVIKVYTSGISGNKEVKKRQQRIMMILDSKGIKYEAIDITEPGKELEKQFMQDNAKAKDSKHPLPPQIFNEEDYCGDYDGFDLANENDVLEAFLKLPLPATPVIEPPPVINGTHYDEKDTDGISPDIERNDEIINALVPNTVDSDKTDEKEDINDKDAMDVDNKETDSAVNEDQEVEEGKDEENGDDGGDGDVGGGDAE
ncbi:SH3 domain-binding glutamic acid-rich protein homolog isoform X2 [Halyomorpha halys]|uniref:SH3 domain-binding glutamic acid-rich protein homolog isoform X2 n=1 Tax=Halyomorpha halys TaxID=286706 RepID=UPI0006D4D358|nr:SH3 domain-binding glutamic acid-rich protein homolog isoform X2 [Halyomorpha halys]